MDLIAASETSTPFGSLAGSASASLKALAGAVAGVQPLEMQTFRFSTGSFDPKNRPDEVINAVGDWVGDGRFL